MTRKTGAISALQDVTGLALRVAQAELNVLKAKEESLRRNLVDLTVQKALIARKPRTTADPALIAGAEMRWQRWADQRRAAINVELAQVLALIDQSEHRLRRIFGRDQVAQALTRQVSQENALRIRRRAFYVS